jgi:hypothetical protein
VLAAELSEALAGTPSASSRLSAIALMSSLSLTEVQYLLDADWGAPADATLWLSDPVVRKALAALAPGGATIGTAAYDGLRLQAPPQPKAPTTPEFITYDSVAFRQVVATAVQVMKQHVASPNICNPSVACDGAIVVAMLQAVTDAGANGTPIPTLGGPADPGAWSCTITFSDAGPTTQSCTHQPLCCKGTLTFPGGDLDCVDTTSCISPDVRPDAGGAGGKCLPVGHPSCKTDANCCPGWRCFPGLPGGAACAVPVGGTPTDCGKAVGNYADGQCVSGSCTNTAMDGGIVSQCVCATSAGTGCFADSDCCASNQQATCQQGICCVAAGKSYVGACSTGLGPCCSAFSSGCSGINGTCQ